MTDNKKGLTFKEKVEKLFGDKDVEQGIVENLGYKFFLKKEEKSSWEVEECWLNIGDEEESQFFNRMDDKEKGFRAKNKAVSRERIRSVILTFRDEDKIQRLNLVAVIKDNNIKGKRGDRVCVEATDKGKGLYTFEIIPARDSQERCKA